MPGEHVALKTGKIGASSLKLCSIPPTTEACTEHVHRCHLQVTMWQAALLESPELDSTKFGWELDHIGILVPRTYVLSQILSVTHPPAVGLRCILVHCLHRRTYYSSFTATARPLGIALQHVAARKLGPRSSVYVRVRKSVKIL